MSALFVRENDYSIYDEATTKVSEMLTDWIFERVPTMHEDEPLEMAAQLMKALGDFEVQE